MNKKERIVQWLTSNGVDCNESTFDNNILIDSLGICIDYIDELTSMQNELVDDYDSFSQHKYGDYNFNGKVANGVLTKKEIVTAFATGLAKSCLTPEIGITTLNIISSVSKAFLSKLVVLPNNHLRCVYLRIAILSGKNPRIITTDKLDDFLQITNFAIQCPFCDYFHCEQQNKEVVGICANNISLIDTLKELDKLEVVNFDCDAQSVKMAAILK